MATAEQLFEAVLVDPANADVRKAYQETLDVSPFSIHAARMPFLDAQCGLACKPADDPAGVPAGGWEGSAAERFADQWFGEGIGARCDWNLSADGLEVTVSGYLAMDEQRLSLSPIQAISLCSKGYFDEGGAEADQHEDPSEYEQLARRPSLRYWLSLKLSEKGIPGDCFGRLIQSPNLMHLRRLYVFDCPIGDEGVRAISAATNLGRLRHLGLNSLGEDGEPSDAALAALARSRSITQLESLCLQGGFTDTGVRSLAVSPNLWNVRSLHLHGQVTGDGVAALTTSPHLGRVTTLDLGWFNEAMDDTGVQALVGWRHLSGVRSLGLGATGMTADGLRRLATCPTVKSLRHLDLSHNLMEDESGVAALAASPHLEDIELLNLWDVRPISPELRQALLQRFGSRVRLVPEELAARTGLSGA